MDGPAPGRWTVIRGKSAGVAPGFTVRDEKGEVWFVSFDGRDNPVAPTAAVTVATRLFWALGYNQVETYLTTVRPENIVIGEGATMRAHGKRRPFTKRRRGRCAATIGEERGRLVPRGRWPRRVRAGRSAGSDTTGRVPTIRTTSFAHEHRRELRALQVFGAWTNLVDMKAGNTLDTLVTENGRGIVRHYLQDVGSTFGTGALAPRDGDEGHEYLYEGVRLVKRLVTFGLASARGRPSNSRSIRRSASSKASSSIPRSGSRAFPSRRFVTSAATITFWAALRVMAFTDEQITRSSQDRRLHGSCRGETPRRRARSSGATRSARCTSRGSIRWCVSRCRTRAC